MLRIRQAIPQDVCKISLAYKAQKLYCLFPKFSTSESTDTKYLANNLVYKYECSCKKVYIGETKRRWSIRISEHQKGGVSKSNEYDSVIFQHVQECSQATTVERDKFSCIQKGLRHANARKRYETLFIHYHDKRASSSTMNRTTASKELILF